MCMFIYIYIYIYIHTYIYVHLYHKQLTMASSRLRRRLLLLKIHQRGAQWKQGVLIYMMLYTSALYNTTPIHCTPLRLHPPLMNIQLPRPAALNPSLSVIPQGRYPMHTPTHTIYYVYVCIYTHICIHLYIYIYIYICRPGILSYVDSNPQSAI